MGTKMSRGEYNIQELIQRDVYVKETKIGTIVGKDTTLTKLESNL